MRRNGDKTVHRESAEATYAEGNRAAESMIIVFILRIDSHRVSGKIATHRPFPSIYLNPYGISFPDLGTLVLTILIQRVLPANFDSLY
jgi:hypothetical protein